MPAKPAYDALLKKASWKAQKGAMAALSGGATGVGAALEACSTAYDDLTADELAPKPGSFKATSDVRETGLEVASKIQALHKHALAAETAAKAAAEKAKSITLGGKGASTYALNVATRAGALAGKLTALEREVKGAYKDLEVDFAKAAGACRVSESDSSLVPGAQGLTRSRRDAAR